MTIKMFEVSNGVLSKEFIGHASAVNSVSFSPCGNTIASGSGDMLRPDNSVRIWCVKSRQCLVGPLLGHSCCVRSVLFASGAPGILASCSDDGAVVLWSASDGARLRELSGSGHAVCSLSFSRDGSRLATGSWDKLVRVWDLRPDDGGGGALPDGGGGSALVGHESSVTCVRFSPCGARLASAAWDATLRIWDPVTCRPAAPGPLRGHTGCVRVLGWSRGGAAVASAGDDGAVRLWDAGGGGPLGAAWAGHAGEVCFLSFAPDGNTLATGDREGVVLVWDLLRAAARLALAMAAHPRLGRGSPLAGLEPGLLAAVAAHLPIVA